MLSTAEASIALIHVTWLPGIVSSPLDEGGIDNPHPQELLAYRGAREALVDSANELRDADYDVTAHPRENRDPAIPIGAFCKKTDADARLLVLRLGRHVAGIGRRMALARVTPAIVSRGHLAGFRATPSLWSMPLHPVIRASCTH